MFFRIFLLLAFGLFLHGCTKDDSEVIDVSKIYQTDTNGQLVGPALDDVQWRNVEFSEKELAMFKHLDVEDLKGTTILPISYYHGYGTPNPSRDRITLQAHLSQPAKAGVVIKYVVVDKWMNHIQSSSQRISVFGDTFTFQIRELKSGNYRVYFTYSAEGYEHYYKSWGNIQKL